MKPDFWTPETLERFRILRASGKTLLECADLLGTTRSAASGKARDLKLPSPRVGSGGHAFRKPPTGDLLRDFRAAYEGGLSEKRLRARFRIGPDTIRRWAKDLRLSRGALVAMEQSAPMVALRPVVAPPPRLPPVHPVPVPIQTVRFLAPAVAPCAWPLGEPGTREFHYCDAESVPGRPYCQEHHAIAYVKRRPRLDDEAAPAFPHPSVQLR